VKRFVFIFILFGCPALRGDGQSFPVVKYSTREGLGHSIVYRVYQDKKGLLWLSTDNGLTRYDGQHFENFTTRDGLRASYIFGLAENDTSMLISTFGGGIQFLNGSVIDSAASLAPEIEYPISLLYHDNAVWTIDRNLRLFRITPEGKEQLSGTTIETAKSVNSVGVSRLGITVCSYGLFVYDTVQRKLRELDFEWGNSKGAYVQWFLELSHDKWLVSANDLYIVDVVTKKTRIVLRGNFLFGARNLLACRDGSFLAAENTGTLWRFNTDFTYKEKILEGVVINDMYEDTAGGIWLGTHGQGLWHIPTLHARHFTLDGLLSPSITFSQRHGGAVITSLNKSILLVDSTRTSNLGNTNIPIKLQPGIIVYSESGRDETILGTLGGLVHFHEDGADSLSFGFPQSAILTNEDGSLWSGARTGLYKVNPRLTDYTAVSFFKSKIVRALAHDELTNVWIGTSSGLFVLKPESKPEDKPFQIFFKGNDVTALHFDAGRNVIWVGTHNGLFQIDRSYQIKSVYPQVRVQSILCDKRNHLWAGSSSGEIYYDGNRYELFTTKEGIPGNILRHAYDPEKDVLYVLSSSGVSALKLDHFLNNRSQSQPVLFITDQIIDGKRRTGAKVLQNLPASTQAISLAFANSYFQNTELWNLYYRILPQPWVNAGKTRELRFFELPPGEGQIEIKLRDDINARESTVLALPYIIDIPLFQKTGFVWGIALTCSLVGIGLTGVLMRTAAQRKQRKLLARQRKIELEQKVLHNMLNPHFLNNAVNSIQVFVTRNDQRKTLGYLAKFARLMRVNIELLEKSVITLEKEIHNIELYLTFEQLRLDGKLEYEINLAKDIHPMQLKVPSLVLQPFVENAIWHGILPKESSGKVTVAGIGLEASLAQPKSNPDKVSKGVSLIRERFELLNQQNRGYSFTIEDKKNQHPPGQGTLVRIHIPVVA
jgi:ligand-binding sensor domain-containing protein